MSWQTFNSLQFLNHLSNKAPYLPPEVTWHSFIYSPDTQVAIQIFLQNALLLGIVWLWGIAVITTLVRVFPATSQGNGATFQNKESTRLAALSWGFLAFPAGMALLITVLFLLACTHQLTRDAIQLLFPLITLIAVGISATRWRAIHQQIQWQSTKALLITLCMLFISAGCLFSLPSLPTPGDAFSFHLPYAGFMVEQHGLGVNEHLIYPYHTLNINLLYSLGIIFDNDYVYLQTLHGQFAVLSMFGLYALARAMRIHWILATTLPILFMHNYTVKYSAIVANVDLGGTFFVLGCLFAFWCWLESQSRAFLALSAICLGMAMGSKYILCSMALPVALCIIGFRFPRFWRDLLFYAGWAAVFGLWWYIRNWILAGNPVHPFATSIFGYYLWTPEDMTSQMEALNSGALPRNLQGILTAPLLAAQNNILRIQGVSTPLIVLWVSTALCWLVSRRTNWLLTFSWVWVIAWIFQSQDPRHFLPALPSILLHAAAVANNLLNRLKYLLFTDRRVWLARSTALAASLLLLFILYQGFLLVRYNTIQMYSTPLAPSPEHDKALHLYPTFDIFLHANKIFSKDETVYEFGNREGRWLFHGNLVGTLYGLHGYQRVANASVVEGKLGIDPQKLQQVLETRYHAAGFIIPLPPYFPYDLAAFDAWFDLKYRNAESSVYRFRKKSP